MLHELSEPQLEVLPGPGRALAQLLVALEAPDRAAVVERAVASFAAGADVCAWSKAAVHWASAVRAARCLSSCSCSAGTGRQFLRTAPCP